MLSSILNHRFVPVAGNLAACFVLGYVGAFAMVPMNLLPLIFISLSGFYFFLTKTQRPLRAFWYGYVFGIGYFVSGLAWIGNAFEVEGNPFSWVMPIAVIGLPMLLSVFPALSAYATRRWFRLDSVEGFFAFVVILSFAEWTRGHIFSGFPWNLYGHAWAFSLPAIQIVSFSNVYFLNLLSVFWMTLPGFILIKPHKTKAKMILLAAALISFGASYGFGLWRLQAHPVKLRDDVSLNIVQPNIPQAEKWRRDKMVGAFYKHVALSYTKEAVKGTTYVIWPETALTPWFANDYSSMQAVAAALRSYSKAYLLAGDLIYNEADNTNHNALVLIDRDGKILNSYDKSHLVPFGEYVPYKKFIPIKPVAEFNGFESGKGAQTFETPDHLRYSPVICYEVIFSGDIVDEKGPRPDLIVNVTNDAWYGDSPGPYQHFAQAMFRAVEEGIPVARSANTGISGLIDPLGRVVKAAPLFEDASLVSQLPASVGHGENPYLKAGFFWLFSLGALFIAIGPKLRSFF